MPLLITYLLKLSISLSVVYLFYHFVLQRMTFYNWNRWYLISYTILCFFIPFIDISFVLAENNWNEANIVRWVPAIDNYQGNVSIATDATNSLSAWKMISLLLVAGMVIMLIRLLIQLFSFKRMMGKAEFISDEGMKIYQVNEKIIPFSFGNSIFINRHLHSENELQEIILHEFVHVKQRHSIDIIWSEILCLLNWYNPFVWLIRKSIRQNLEFIADNKVLENGVDRKQYQYLLLKVIGNNHFSIAQKFNFSSLKKRIAMMNKIKSARVNLLRFLFVLPLLAVILVSFRDQIGDSFNGSNDYQLQTPAPVAGTDSVPKVTKPNSKGYLIDVIDVKGNCTIVVKDKKGKEVKRILMNDWTEKDDESYGEILPPPPAPPAPPDAPVKSDLPDNVRSVRINNNKATVTLEDGTIEKYDLDKLGEKNKFEKKYGPPPPTPATPRSPATPAAPVKGMAIAKINGVDNLALLCDEYAITNNKATMHLKNGKTEEYDLTNIEQRRDFEKKFGKIIHINKDHSDMSAPTPVAMVHDASGQTVIAPMSNAARIAGGVMMIDKSSYVINGEEDVLITITHKTTRQQLEQYKQQMKEKGIELTYDEIKYDDKGLLVELSGQMKSKDGHSNFNALDFGKLILAMVKDGEHTYFKVSTTDRKVVI